MGLIPRKELTGYTLSGGALVDGIWQGEVKTPFTFYASVQPLREREMEMLPEGRRNSISYRLYTDKLMNTVEVTGQNPDYVVIEGETFEVFSRANWKNNIIPHYKYIVIRIDKVVA